MSLTLRQGLWVGKKNGGLQKVTRCFKVPLYIYIYIFLAYCICSWRTTCSGYWNSVLVFSFQFCLSIPGLAYVCSLRTPSGATYPKLTSKSSRSAADEVRNKTNFILWHCDESGGHKPQFVLEDTSLSGPVLTLKVFFLLFLTFNWA